MSDINALLWRKVLLGKQYDPLIPKSNCTQKDVGIGMTDLSVKEMAEMVKISLVDTAAIAPLFSNSSLKETCAAIIIKMVKELRFSENYAYFDKNRYTIVPLETIFYNIASGTVYNPEEESNPDAEQEPVPVPTSISKLNFTVV